MKPKKMALLLLCLPVLLLAGMAAKWAIYGINPDFSLKIPSPDGRYLATKDYWDGFLHGQICVRLKPTNSVLPPDTIAFSNEITDVKWVGPRSLRVTWKKYFSPETIGDHAATWRDVRIVCVADPYSPKESTGLKIWSQPGAVSNKGTGISKGRSYITIGASFRVCFRARTVPC